MERLTAIRIKYPDGTFSEDIVLSVYAKNVNYDDTRSLVDIVNGLNERINNLAVGTPGSVSTDLDNELIDIRVGADGKRYSTAGDAVRQNIIKSRDVVIVREEQPTEPENKLWIKKNDVEQVQIAEMSDVPKVDNTLSVSGAAADAKKAGNIQTSLQVLQKEYYNKNNIIKRPPWNRERQNIAGNLFVQTRGTKIYLNGSNSENGVVLQMDVSREDHADIAYRHGFNSGFFSDNSSHPQIIQSGKYRLNFYFLSGTVTRDGIVCTTNSDLSRDSDKIVAGYLMKADATDSKHYIKRLTTITSSQIEVQEETSFGLLCLYLYKGCSFENAVFQLFVEKINQIDKTLTKDNVAAEAKATGEKIFENENYTSQVTDVINDNLNIVRHPQVNKTRTAYGITATAKRYQVLLNGTSTSEVCFILDDIWTILSYNNGFNSDFLQTKNAVYPQKIQPGEYQLVFKLRSGTVSRFGEDYTNEIDFGSTNVVRGFLVQAGQEKKYLIKTEPSTTRKYIDKSETGLFVIYIYKEVTCTDAIFDIYLRKVQGEDQEKIPKYWNSELIRSIKAINDNILNSSYNSSTILFVTDCHWRGNQKFSPYLANYLLKNCNINYFINGGDMIYKSHEKKEDAVKELRECISAFKNSLKPMICLYGNHDRNRSSGNKTYTDRHLSKMEHANTVFKSFPVNDGFFGYGVNLLQTNYDSFYWEDKKYRYVCLYWYDSDSMTLSYMKEMFNTEKQVIIFCHGIYYHIDADPEKDVIDNSWILNSFEPYKNQIRCFIQGHVHRDAIRYAWDTVPIVIIDCDTINGFSTKNTITEQSLAGITIDDNIIKVVKCGKGSDFIIQEGTPIWRQEYQNEINQETSDSETNPGE